MLADTLGFQKSITKELDVVKNRVRYLIGNANWGEEGRYKEAVLKNVIKKFLPNNLSVGSGFIIKGGTNDTDPEISSQLDIIIYNNTIPVLFNEGDFIITTEQNVRGIIEVKTKVINSSTQGNSIESVVNKFNNLPLSVVYDLPNKASFHRSIFTGLFSFEYEDNIEGESLEQSLRCSNGKINHIALGTKYFIRYWKNSQGLNPPIDCPNHFYNIYMLENLSFSYFISNLVHMTSDFKLRDRFWYSYPIPGTKELHRKKTICLEND